MRPLARWLIPIVLLSGCGTAGTGNWPNRGSLIGDATIRVSPGYSLTVEKIVFGSAGAVLLYALYDPLAPNWTIDEEAVAEDRFRLTLTMKRFTIGGEGEALAVLRRWAEAVQLEGQYDGYRIERFEQGIESSTPFARRYAHASVRMTRAGHPELPAVQVAGGDAVARIGADQGERRLGDADGRTAAAVDPSPREPLPRPPPLPGAAAALAPGPLADEGETAVGDLPRPPPLGVSQVALNARVLFDFDSARLTAAGRTALEREVVARRDELGRLAVILVSGHTDRIGSYEYNQRLSEARARTVRDFLAGRGFEGRRIASVGYGKTRPLAGFPCDEALPRGALIDCLAPQRRVELEFRELD
jgi:outer membrane protein OmpA-like peptidoglycan-associated protein